MPKEQDTLNNNEYPKRKQQASEKGHELQITSRRLYTHISSSVMN
jgi:hypothetical protein